MSLFWWDFLNDLNLFWVLKWSPNIALLFFLTSRKLRLELKPYLKRRNGNVFLFFCCTKESHNHFVLKWPNVCHSSAKPCLRVWCLSYGPVESWSGHIVSLSLPITEVAGTNCDVVSYVSMKTGRLHCANVSVTRCRRRLQPVSHFGIIFQEIAAGNSQSLKCLFGWRIIYSKSNRQ